MTHFPSSNCISPENTRKPKVKPKIFWCFQGVKNGNIDQTWGKLNLSSKMIFQSTVQYILFVKAEVMPMFYFASFLFFMLLASFI